MAGATTVVVDLGASVVTGYTLEPSTVILRTTNTSSPCGSSSFAGLASGVSLTSATPSGSVPRACTEVDHVGHCYVADPLSYYIVQEYVEDYEHDMKRYLVMHGKEHELEGELAKIKHFRKYLTHKTEEELAKEEKKAAPEPIGDEKV
eukprot:scaffold2840_cov379-Prasinococcus_capsulatus_cf.AAC.7